jgi:hypothetical protein
MEQGYSGSTVRREGCLVAKTTSDRGFVQSAARQRDLVVLSQRLAVLPRIDRIEGPVIYMEYIEGSEGLTLKNARRAGQALRQLHEQRDYPHPCFTGVAWLIEGANDSLARTDRDLRIAPEVAVEYPADALIQTEPAQFIEKPDGSIVFIDFEGMGMGSRYQDLGFVYYEAILDGEPELFAAFLEGYQQEPGEIDLGRVKRLAGVIALAYAQFADEEKRIALGLRLLEADG